MKKLGFALAICMALTAISGAQGGGQGRGFRMPGMEKAMEYFNLRRGDVQTDLKLTDDQKSKLTAAQEDMQGKMRDAFTSGGGGGDPEAMQATMKKLMDDLVTSIKAIITPDQQKRLDEINIQLQGGAILADTDMQKTLNLTADQLKQIKDLQAKQDEANASLMEKVQNGDIDRQEVGPMMQKNRTALGVAMEKCLPTTKGHSLRN